MPPFSSRRHWLFSLLADIDTPFSSMMPPLFHFLRHYFYFHFISLFHDFRHYYCHYCFR
jgi:hypothetical protein